MNLPRWRVQLTNEDGAATYWTVHALTHMGAIREAWRQYREIPHWDGAYPPDWTDPVANYEA